MNDKHTENRISKNNYYLDIAESVLSRGTCLRRNYGSVIVKNDTIVSTGYTGAPRKRENCCDLGYCIRNEQNVPRGERYELCLHSDTLIRTADGVDTIESLSKNINRQTCTIYSFNNGKIIPIKVKKPFFTGTKNLLSIRFDDGSTRNMTPDHKVMLSDGSYKEAKTLNRDDVLMGYIVNENGDIKLIEKHIDFISSFSNIPVSTYDISVPATENFAIELSEGTGIFVHNCRSVHSEVNAIINASKEDMKDATLYLVGMEKETGNYVENANSCSMCKRVIINSGISKIIIRDTKEHYREISVSDWINEDDYLSSKRGY